MTKKVKSKTKRSKPVIDLAEITTVCRQVVRGTPDEDFVQDVCLKVIENAHKYTGRSSWTTWVYSVARNLLISQQRHKDVEQRYITRIRNETAP
jgi:RNA polymerase sigma factor (sigma-70 family)